MVANTSGPGLAESDRPTGGACGIPLVSWHVKSQDAPFFFEKRGILASYAELMFSNQNFKTNPRFASMLMLVWSKKRNIK